MRNVNIIEYLPNVIKDVKEFNEIAKTENPEITLLWENIQNVFDDQFVKYATENGVKRWEKILEIIPKANHTLEDRKFVILAKLNEKLPYTIRVLHQMLAQLCGKDGYELTLNHNIYELNILVELKSKNMVEAVEDLFRRILPANLGFTVKIRYNQHMTLKLYRHIDLRPFTHFNIRNEVIEL